MGKKIYDLTRKLNIIESMTFGLYGSHLLKQDEGVVTSPSGKLYGILIVGEDDTVISAYEDLTLDDTSADWIGVELPAGTMLTGCFKDITISAGILDCKEFPHNYTE